MTTQLNYRQNGNMLGNSDMNEDEMVEFSTKTNNENKKFFTFIVINFSYINIVRNIFNFFKIL